MEDDRLLKTRMTQREIEEIFSFANVKRQFEKIAWLEGRVNDLESENAMFKKVLKESVIKED